MIYHDKEELSHHWVRDFLFGVDKLCIVTDSDTKNNNVSHFYIKKLLGI